LKMRQILLRVANEHGKVNWGSTCSGVSSHQDGRLRLR
jgi:hypothetical protein